MNCQRCNGLMYPFELRDRRAQGRAAGLVCLLCGEIVDPVIAGNRTRSPELLQPVRSARRRSRLRRVFMR